MNVADYIMKFFSEKGVNTVFMIVGGHAMYLNDAVAKSPKLQVICNHHEQACTMSACGYASVSGTPAIACVTAGPGALNAINGVVGAFTDSLPLIVISGQSDIKFVKYQRDTNVRQIGVQGLDIKPMVEKYVKYFVTLDDTSMIRHHLEIAWQEAISGRMGPVWIDVPLDVQRAEFDEKAQKETSIPVPCKPEPTQDEIETVLQKISNAKRPLFIAGHGIRLANARAEFLTLSKKLNIPCVTTGMSVDLIDSDDDLFVGRPGNYGDRAGNFAIQNADLIISLGCRLATPLIGFKPHLFGENAFKIMVDIDETELNKELVPIDIKIKSDCKIFIEKLLESPATLPSFTSWVERCKNWKYKYYPLPDSAKSDTPINTYYFFSRLSDFLKNDDILVTDSGSCLAVSRHIFKIKDGQKFVSSGGVSSMGYWAASVGACVGNNKKQTICAVGDGSFQMNIQELAVIKHNNLPIKIFVINNDGYLLLRNTQRNFMQDRFIGESPESGLWCPNSVDIAQAYGIKSFRIESPDEIDEKIQEIIAYDGPVICDVVSLKWQTIAPRVMSRKAPDGTLISTDFSDMFPFLPRDEYEENMRND